MKQTPPEAKNNCCIPSRNSQHDLPTSGDLTAKCDLPAKQDESAKHNLSTKHNLSLKHEGKHAGEHKILLQLYWRKLPGGWFHMGTDKPRYRQDGESPRRAVFVSPFSIAATTVSNADFARFVSSTGYITSAETIGRSFVFSPGSGQTPSASTPVAYAPWWQDTESACWHAPAGKGSSIEDIPDHPVTHVSYKDALHYCDWSGTRLPSEAQWEYAARGENTDCDFPWGNTLAPEDQHYCNVWQGQFPTVNLVKDGYALTAPVDAFPPNSFGLYNMTGNVWEWVADRFTTNHSPRPTKNPAGPLNGNTYVTRGGSFLCHSSYCARYHVFSRQSLTADTSSANVGFRVTAA